MIGYGVAIVLLGAALAAFAAAVTSTGSDNPGARLSKADSKDPGSQVMRNPSRSDLDRSEQGPGRAA